MHPLQERFIKHWKDRLFIPAGGTVLLAVSGGLDSMVMAGLFLDAGLPFAVAHCNFGLRGAAADEDEAFVQAWCSARDKRCFTIRFDTAASAAASGKGIQETARNLRYAWFRALCVQEGLTAICTAHHADDNAETMLINLCRGAGISGLHGIPERNGNIVRPLLFATRAELADYAAAGGIAWREDASNGQDDYLRNALRHRVLPVLEELLPGAAKRMLAAGSRIGEAELLYRTAIAKERKRLLQQRGNDHYIPLKLLQHRVPLGTICYELLKPFGFSGQQLPFITDLLAAESGRFLDSPTHRLIRNRDFFIITPLQPAGTGFILVESLDQQVVTADGVFQLTLLQQPPQQLEEAPGLAYIDAARLQQPLIFRRWKAGDYFYPLGMGMKKKKLSRFFIDQKVPLHRKERIWVLESGRRIVWIAGMRLDERFKITPGTGKVLRIRLR